MEPNGTTGSVQRDPEILNSWFRASWFNVNKRSNSMQQYADIYLLQSHSTCFGCHAPIISSTKNCISATSGVCHGNGTVTSFHPPFTLAWVRIRPRWKEVTVPLPWHTPEVADTVFSTPDDGCLTPETCRVTWQWINVCILLHRVGPLLTLNHDARNHVFKMQQCIKIFISYLYKAQHVSGDTSSIIRSLKLH